MARKTLSVAPGAAVKARVLLTTHVDGTDYEPDAVISASASIIKLFEEQGFVDSDSDAVSYAESLKV